MCESQFSTMDERTELARAARHHAECRERLHYRWSACTTVAGGLAVAAALRQGRLSATAAGAGRDRRGDIPACAGQVLPGSGFPHWESTGVAEPGGRDIPETCRRSSCESPLSC